MLPVNEYHFYELAVAIHPLTFAPNETKYSDVWYTWWNAKQILNTTFVERRPLSICRPAAEKLYAAITAFVPTEFGEAAARYPSDPDEIDPVLGHDAYAIREAAKEFETVLQAELQSMDTYFVSQKGGYKTHDLIERAHFAFPLSVRNSLREQTKADFDQAGKCIAFDIPTAAGFHLLRGTESAIRDYYKIVTGKEPKLQMRNWGAYNKNLKKKGASVKVTDIIEHIRVVYRNPVLHPEENLTSEEALVLFGICMSAVTLMIAEIKRLTATGLPLQFPASSAIALPATDEEAKGEAASGDA